MHWQEVKKSYPSKWLIIEAIGATTEDKKRIINELTVVDTFDDSSIALKKYLHLHREFPNREMYVIHSSRPELDIEEIKWAGVRRP